MYGPMNKIIFYYSKEIKGWRGSLQEGTTGNPVQYKSRRQRFLSEAPLAVGGGW